MNTKNIDDMKYIKNHFDDCIVNSWSWNRLTEFEKQAFLDSDFSEIKGIKENQILLFNDLYFNFLESLGCNSMSWRK